MDAPPCQVWGTSSLPCGSGVEKRQISVRKYHILPQWAEFSEPACRVRTQSPLQTYFGALEYTDRPEGDQVQSGVRSHLQSPCCRSERLYARMALARPSFQWTDG